MQTLCVSSEVCLCVSSEDCVYLPLAVTPNLLAAWLLFFPLLLPACLKAGSRCFVTPRSESLREMEPLWARLCRRRRESLHFFSFLFQCLSSLQKERALSPPPVHNCTRIIPLHVPYPYKISPSPARRGDYFLRSLRNVPCSAEVSPGRTRRECLQYGKRGMEMESDTIQEKLLFIRSIRCSEY